MAIRLSEPAFLGREQEYVAKAMEQRALSQAAGEYVEAFEEAFARAHGCAYGVAVTSGTMALRLAFWVQDRHDRIVYQAPAMTYVATVAALADVRAGAAVLDVDPETWHMGPRWIEGLATERFSKVSAIPVHLFGSMADVEPGDIEDCAQAHGATTADGVPAGSQGLMGCFSFYGNKILTTGEGGMVVTNHRGFAEGVRSLRSHCALYDSPNHGPYFSGAFGTNARMTNLQGALGLAQTECLAEHLERRRKLEQTYHEALKPLIRDGLVTLQRRHEGAAPWLMPVLVDDPRALATALAAQGIETRPFFVPLHQLPMLTTRFDCPAAERIARRGLMLPLHANMTSSDVEQVCAVVTRELRG